MANVKNIALELINKGYTVVPQTESDAILAELGRKYHMCPLGGALVDDGAGRVIYIY